MNRKERRQAQRSHQARMRRLKTTFAEQPSVDPRQDPDPWVRALAEHALGRTPPIENEQFSIFRAGVLSTTGVDLEGDAFTVEALAGMASQIRSGCIFLNVEHDPSVQPVGRILGSSVRYNPGTGHHELIGIVGYYDQSRYTSLADAGIADPFFSRPATSALPSVPTPESPSHLSVSVPNSGRLRIMAKELVESAPAIFDPSIDETVEKSGDDGLTMFIAGALGSWVAALAMGLAEPIGALVLKEAERQALTAAQRLCQRWDKLRGRKAIVHTERIDKCKIDYVAHVPRERDLRLALVRLEGASSAAHELARANAHVIHQTWTFSLPDQAWRLQFLVSREYGVITDRPVLVKAETFPGFSVGVGGVVRR